MTNKWTEDDSAALDALLAKFPLSEIAAKAKQRPRRPVGRPAHGPHYPFAVFLEIEVARLTDRDPGNPLTIKKAADKLAKRLACEGKPIAAKTLVRIHREQCRTLGLSPNSLGIYPATWLDELADPPKTKAQLFWGAFLRLNHWLSDGPHLKKIKLKIHG